MSVIVDQCRHCLHRGYLEDCQKDGCSQHESWYGQEMRVRLKKAEQHIKELVSALSASLEWIDAIPEEAAASLPVMPGFDRDWASNLLDSNWTPEEGE